MIIETELYTDSDFINVTALRLHTGEMGKDFSHFINHKKITYFEFPFTRVQGEYMLKHLRPDIDLFFQEYQRVKEIANPTGKTLFTPGTIRR